MSNNIDNIFDVRLWNTVHTIPTVEVAGIIDSCFTLAEIDGFINPVGASCILWLYLTRRLLPDMEQKIDNMVEGEEGIFGTMDFLQKNNIIDRLCKEYPDDISYVFNLAKSWYEQYAKFVPSFAGQVGKLSFLSEDFVKDALNNMQKVLSNDNIEKITKLAENWGMNNELQDNVENSEL